LDKQNRPSFDRIFSVQHLPSQPFIGLCRPLKTETENCSLRPPHTFGKPFQSRSIESSLLATPTPCALLPLEETLAYLASCFIAAAINKQK
jgi:hypothetical protein